MQDLMMIAVAAVLGAAVWANLEPAIRGIWKRWRGRSHVD